MGPRKAYKGRLKNLSLSELISRLAKAHTAFRYAYAPKSSRDWNLDMKALVTCTVSALYMPRLVSRGIGIFIALRTNLACAGDEAR